MSKKIIEVIIQKDHITAKEVNPYGEVKPTHRSFESSPAQFGVRKRQWEEAESKLRTFNIDSFDEATKVCGGKESFEKDGMALTSANVLYEPYSRKKAEILPSGKIKIIEEIDGSEVKFRKTVAGLKGASKEFHTALTTLMGNEYHALGYLGIFENIHKKYRNKKLVVGKAKL